MRCRVRVSALMLFGKCRHRESRGRLPVEPKASGLGGIRSAQTGATRGIPYWDFDAAGHYVFDKPDSRGDSLPGLDASRNAL